MTSPLSLLLSAEFCLALLPRDARHFKAHPDEHFKAISRLKTDHVSPVRLSQQLRSSSESEQGELFAS